MDSPVNYLIGLLLSPISRYFTNVPTWGSNKKVLEMRQTAILTVAPLVICA